MSVLNLEFYSDPGHGWAKVDFSVLKQLNIADKISLFSYRKGKNVYLEEDCDYFVLIQALKANNVAYTINEHHTNQESIIRSYPLYHV